MPLVSGTRLGPYEVIEPLGKGAMGEVYRARDSRLGRDVAIKVLPEHTASSPDALARFEFEARAVAALNHPNILALHDVGSTAGVSYAVTELLAGETLRDRLARDGALPPRKALDVAIQFAQGLAAAHARGIIHRDLKPENLFLTADGRLKILDFGIAVYQPSSSAATAAETRISTDHGVLIGTISYMSPEQVRGEPASASSDVFAFGLVVHEMLIGSNPFQRPTAAETMATILRDDAPSLTTVKGVPATVARVIDRCLEKRASDRPDSLRDIAFFLDAAAGATTATPTSSTAESAEASRQTARWRLMAICALIGSLTLASWLYVRAGLNRAVDDAITADLARAGDVVARAQQERLGRLRLSARLVASFPELRALFGTDALTIRATLVDYQTRNPDAPLLIALSPAAEIVARGDEESGVVKENGDAWLKILRATDDAAVISVDGRPYHAAVASAEAGGTIFGAIIAAAPIDNVFAQILREATEDEVVLLDTRGVAGTSLRSGQVPWDSLQAFRNAVAREGSTNALTIGNAQYTAKEVLLAKDPEVVAVILASRNDVAASYRGVDSGVLLIGMMGALIVLVAGSLVIRRMK